MKNKNNDQREEYTLLIAAYNQINLNKAKEKLLALSSWHCLNQSTLNHLPNEPNKSGLYSIQLHLAGDFVADISWQKQLRAICWPLSVDFLCTEQALWETPRHLAVFDMDSTLIKNEVIDELASEHQVGHLVADITEQAMRGELNFDQSIKARVKLLKGLSASAFTPVNQRLVAQDGLDQLFTHLQSKGTKTAILSGGFSQFAEPLGNRLGVQHTFTNQLEIDNTEHLTGKLNGKIVNAEYKAKLLQELSTTYNLNLNQTIALGDGANDIPMLQTAGIGIAFHAKPKVIEEVKHAINYAGLELVSLCV